MRRGAHDDQFVHDDQHDHAIDDEFNDVDHRIAVGSDDVDSATILHDDRGCAGYESAADAHDPGNGRP